MKGIMLLVLAVALSGFLLTGCPPAYQKSDGHVVLSGTAPSVPTNLVAIAASATQISLTWTASTDAGGVTGYKIYRNGTQIGTSASASYNDPTAVANARYLYTVSAYDAVPNNSTQSTALGVVLAASCAYADVNAAVTTAQAVDTVLAPAGTATWTSTLVIMKGMILKGSGIGNTTIVGTIPNDGTNRWMNQPIIAYSPANYDLNAPFRITGFTFDLINRTPMNDGIALGTKNKAAPFTVQTKVRVDHNSFIHGHGDIGTPRPIGIYNYCVAYGVVDNNLFDDVDQPTRNERDGDGSAWWDNFTYTFGTNDSLYYEDNTFNKTGGLAQGQNDARYTFRYNTINIVRDCFPIFDMHGNYPDGAGHTGSVNGAYSCFGGEMYGNRLDGAGSFDIELIDQRGGKVLVFFNNMVSTLDAPIIQIREEYIDSEEPTTNPQPQHVSDSYYWGNVRNGSALISPNIYSTLNYGPPIGNVPQENRDFYNQNISFSGTTGMGVGTLANRPTTCTPGVAYWATDQDYTNLSDYVGAHPKTPISGTLYKCTAPNVWTAYYTPYTYPHPLRTSGPLADIPTDNFDTTPPAF